jgi:uncharacterized membrane protein
MDGVVLMRTFAYVNAWKVSGALWLNQNIDAQNTAIYADRSAHEFGYGMVRYRQPLTNTTEKPSDGIVYLSYLNVVEGIVVTDYYIFNSTELSFIDNMNKIYANGGVEIYETKSAPSP